MTANLAQRWPHSLLSAKTSDTNLHRCNVSAVLTALSSITHSVHCRGFCFMTQMKNFYGRTRMTVEPILATKAQKSTRSRRHVRLSHYNCSIKTQTEQFRFAYFRSLFFSLSPSAIASWVHCDGKLVVYVIFESTGALEWGEEMSYACCITFRVLMCYSIIIYVGCGVNRLSIFIKFHFCCSRFAGEVITTSVAFDSICFQTTKAWVELKLMTQPLCAPLRITRFINLLNIVQSASSFT